MNYANIPCKSTIHLYRGSSTRSLLSRGSWTGNCTGVYTIVQKEDKHFLYNGGVQFVSTTMPAKQKYLQIQKNRGRSIVKFIDDLSKMQRTEVLVRNAETNFWQTQSKPSLCTSLYAGRMLCKSSKKMETRLGRKRQLKLRKDQK